MNRREFLQSMVAATGATTLINSGISAPLGMQGSDKLGTRLPMRPLGKTGEFVTLLGLGGYHMAVGSERDSQQLIEAALEEGIRFFDCAVKYHRGVSETRYGQFLTPKYRDDVYLMTKCDTRDPEIPAQQQLEDSLRRMNTDYVDLWMVHTIIDEEDAEKRVNEMFEVAQKAKAEGKIRHFGFSGHKATEAHLKALQTLGKEADVALMPMSPNDFVSDDSFIINVLPKLVENGTAPLAMKTMNAGQFNRIHGGKNAVPERISLEEHQWFTLSLPISTWISGIQTLEQVRENANIARRFTKLSEKDRLSIADKVSDMANIPALQPYRAWNT